MNTAIHIVLADDPVVQMAAGLPEFITNSPQSFAVVPADGKVLCVIKNENLDTYEKVRMLAGDISRELGRRKADTAVLQHGVLEKITSSLDSSIGLTAFVEGWHLGAYSFRKYKKSGEQRITNLEVIGGDEAAIKAGQHRADAVAFSRDLMNELPNVLNPETFPGVLEEAFRGKPVDISVYKGKALEDMEMNGLLAVGRGSRFAPSFVEMSYKGDSSRPLTVLLGKGVTFDTGGISLKSGRDLSDMRMDMGGAAAVAGAMKLLADSGAAVNVTALLPIVENMPDSQSLLPSEVIRYRNGVTVQVGNTDAEGRLILADGLIRAGELGAEYIVDIATLTGAIANALGSKMGGVFGDEELSEELKSIGRENGDPVWPMPLVQDYVPYLNSDYADMNNISSKGEAGSITAALFLQKFVPATSKWLHVDMAGVMESSQAKGYYAKSATGYGARLLADFAVSVSEGEN